ncbi:hypothetical protein ACQ4LE_008767 [Meloidogyne hapla]|uniref:YL1_C domain-containing protein n=1 Tax=Meloidogyne hapla TaxID=6305 RepID=A0A1I8B3A3_MELHA
MIAKKAKSAIDVEQEGQANEEPKMAKVDPPNVPIGESDDVQTAIMMEEIIPLTKVTTDKIIKKTMVSKEVQCELGQNRIVDAPPLAVDSLRYSAYYHPIRQMNPSPYANVVACVQTQPYNISLFSELKKKIGTVKEDKGSVPMKKKETGRQYI